MSLWLNNGVELLSLFSDPALQPLFRVYFFLCGLVTGSFLNVCIYRIPLGISVVTPRSRCPHCNTIIRWYHNIPVLSYLALRGKCHNCKAKISPIYPLVELLTGCIFLFTFMKFGLSRSFFIYLYFCCCMILLMFIDFNHRILPDVLTLSGIVLGFAASFFTDLGWLGSLKGILLGGAMPAFALLMYKWIRKKEGMGHGDIKMLAMVGAFLGWNQVFLVMLLSSILGSIVGIGGMLIFRKDSDFEWPFGTFIAIAAIFAVFYGPLIWHYYLHL